MYKQNTRMPTYIYKRLNIHVNAEYIWCLVADTLNALQRPTHSILKGTPGEVMKTDLLYWDKTVLSTNYKIYTCYLSKKEA